MVVNMSDVNVVLALYRAIESGMPLEAARFTEDAETIERPNLLKPTGARSPLSRMIADSQRGAGLLARQHYDVHSAIDAGGLVITRLTWTGTVASAVGPFAAGQELVAHIAQFVEVVEGRIRRIETYDCYEPF